MNLLYSSYLIIVLCEISFLVRVIPRLFLRNAIVADAWGHLYFSEKLRSNGLRVPKHIPQILLGHEYTYPYLYQLALALFPLRIRFLAESLTGPVFDTLIILVAYLTTLHFAPAISSADPVLVANVTSILFAFTPAFLRVGSGPRAYNGSARLPGQLFYMIHVVSAFWALESGSLIAGGLSIFAAAIIYLLSVFATQVLFGIGIALVLFFDWRYLWFPLLGFIASNGVTGGSAFSVVRGWMTHSKFYYQHLQSIFLYPHIEKWEHYKANVKVNLQHLRERDFTKFFSWYSKEQYWLHLLFASFPLLIILPVAYWNLETGNNVVRFLSVWLAASLATFALTKQKRFLFLGEGERYTEFSVLPLTILAVVGLVGGSWWLLALIGGYSIILSVFSTSVFINTFQDTAKDYDDSQELFAHLNTLPEGVVLPVGWIHYQTLFNTTFPVVTHSGNIDPKLLPVEEFMLVYGNYPYPGSNFEKIIDDYNVSYVLAEVSCLSTYVSSLVDDPNVLYRSLILIKKSKTLALYKTTQHISHLCQEASALLNSGDFSTGMTRLLELEIYLPNEPSIILPLVDCFVATGDTDQALVRLKRLATTDPASDAAARISEILGMTFEIDSTDRVEPTAEVINSEVVETESAEDSGQLKTLLTDLKSLNSLLL